MAAGNEVGAVEHRKVIGIYGLCNTGAVLVYQIDYAEDKVLAGINDTDPEWCDMKDKYSDENGELESGFVLGQLFIPFSEVVRFYGG